MNIIPDEVEINGKKYYTKKATALRLGIHPVTLQHEANKKRITFLKHPSYGLCFSLENLAEWVQKRTQNAR